jgi:hypothetical protein
MKRRINYTGRKRISLERISINLVKNEHSKIFAFNAVIKLDDLALPKDSKVYVEAYNTAELRRFDFGIIGNILQPADTTFKGIMNLDNLKFRVLVVDESSSHGRILAQIDNIRTQSPSDKISILPVEFLDLGRQLWQLEFNGDEGSPSLLLNKSIPNIENIAKTSPEFKISVYPPVIREVLIHLIFIDGVDNISDPPIDWHKDWLQFAKSILPSESIPKEILESEVRTDNNSEEIALAWINKVVEEFCNKRNEWEDYLNRLKNY